MNESSVRVRFAPSSFHSVRLCDIRIAVLNWLFARAHSGRMFLRFDGIDELGARMTYPVHTARVLTVLGLVWDGDVLYQSARLHIYTKIANTLVAQRRARYVGKSNAIELIFDPDRAVSFRDSVRGECTVSYEDIGPVQLIQKSGYPTDVFMSVVDNNAVGITHVIRDDEYWGDVPKEILLSEDLGYRTPKYAHIPQLYDPAPIESDLHSKAPFSTYLEAGYLREPLLQYLGSLGVEDAVFDSFLSLDSLVKVFSIANIIPHSATHDLHRLNDLAICHMRLMDDEAFCTRMKEFFASHGVVTGAIRDDKLNTLLVLYKGVGGTILDLVDAVKYAWAGVTYEPESVRVCVKDARGKVAIAQVCQDLEKLSFFSHENLQHSMESSAQSLGISFDALIPLLNLALTGAVESPDMMKIVYILGKDEAVSRLQRLVYVWDSLQELVEE